jgi:hypothetical protein
MSISDQRKLSFIERRGNAFNGHEICDFRFFHESQQSENSQRYSKFLKLMIVGVGN